MTDAKKGMEENDAKMAALPFLWEQDPGETAARHGIEKLPPVLPEVQAGGIGQCTRVYHDENHGAGHTVWDPAK